MRKTKLNVFYRMIINIKSFFLVFKVFLSLILTKIRRSFVIGFIIIFPLGGTVFIVWQLFEFIKSSFSGLYGSAIPWWTGLGITLLIISVIGFLAKFTQNMFMSKIAGLFTKIVNKLPLIRNLYGTIKQLVEIVVSKPKMVFNEVALIEYPRRGIYCLAFITENAPGNITALAGCPKMKSVFLPTTPNPTSGFLLFLPVEDIYIVDMSIEEAMKLIISGGMLTPENIDNLKEGKELEIEE